MPVEQEQAKDTSWATRLPPGEKILASLSQEVAKYSRLQHNSPEWTENIYVGYYIQLLEYVIPTAPIPVTRVSDMIGGVVLN